MASPSSGSSSSSSSASSSSKLIAIPGKISAAYREIQELSTEKEELAQRLVSLIERTRTRLDIELSKVRALQGEPADFPGMPKPLIGVSTTMESMKTPVLAITESLKAALGGTTIAEARHSSPSQPATPVAPPAPTNSHKRMCAPSVVGEYLFMSFIGRKVTTSAPSPSIKLSVGAWTPKRSSSPTVQSAVSTTGNSRSRLSKQIHPPTPDEDEEMEAEGEAEEDNDDDGTYCYCQKKSWGEVCYLEDLCTFAH